MLWQVLLQLEYLLVCWEGEIFGSVGWRIIWFRRNGRRIIWMASCRSVEKEEGENKFPD